MTNLKRPLRSLLVLVFKGYSLLISPLYPATCRHTPTCSSYMIQAIDEWGAFKGLWLGLKRLSKCHPWGTHGHDPVPRNKSCHKCDAESSS